MRAEIGLVSIMAAAGNGQKRRRIAGVKSDRPEPQVLITLNARRAGHHARCATDRRRLVLDRLRRGARGTSDPQTVGLNCAASRDHFIPPIPSSRTAFAQSPSSRSDTQRRKVRRYQARANATSKQAARFAQWGNLRDSKSFGLKRVDTCVDAVCERCAAHDDERTTAPLTPKCLRGGRELKVLAERHTFEWCELFAVTAAQNPLGEVQNQKGTHTLRIFACTPATSKEMSRQKTESNTGSDHAPSGNTNPDASVRNQPHQEEEPVDGDNKRDEDDHVDQCR